MRLFVGIDLPEYAKETLYQLTLELKRCARTGSFVPLENAHLTLAFIGETNQIDTVKRTLLRAEAGYCASPVASASNNPCFELELSGIGTFKQKKGHTWWIGVGGEAGLIRLQTLHDEVVAALRREGFDLENRSYKPHITLARRVQTTHLVHLHPPPLKVPVNEFSLFKSQHIEGKQVYSILASYPFQNRCCTK